MEDKIESLAIRCALGNNGGSWAEHYTEDQKDYWRQFVRDLMKSSEAYDQGYEDGWYSLRRQIQCVIETRD